MEHTKEPWEVVQDQMDAECQIIYPSGKRDIRIADVFEYVPDNAKRIVACVNTCADIPTEWLESGESTIKYYQLKTQRDKLLSHVQYLLKFNCVPEELIEITKLTVAECEENNDK